MKLQVEANRCMWEKSGTKTALHASGGKKLKKGKGKGPQPDDICSYCWATGHWANKCPRCEEDEKAKQGGREKSSLNIGNLQDLGTQEVGQIYMVLSSSTAAPADVLLDCGTSAHMFCNRKYF